MRVSEVQSFERPAFKAISKSRRTKLMIPMIEDDPADLGLRAGR